MRFGWCSYMESVVFGVRMNLNFLKSEIGEVVKINVDVYMSGSFLFVFLSVEINKVLV